MIPEKIKKILKKQHYEIVGNHSGVQVCHWTKQALKGNGVCWKQKFYGVNCLKCCQFSPSIMWCENNCLHCWRPIEMNLGKKISRIDEPKEILEGVIKARKKLLIGFKGNIKVSEEKFKEALEPNFFTFSLSGEPTIYPKMPELVKEVKKRNAIAYLVTNGQNPEMLKRLEKENALPTQVVVSTNAPNGKMFKIWHNSCNKDAWKRFNETLKIIGSWKGKTRRVIRLTLVKEGDNSEKMKEISNMKDKHIKEYANLIKIANPNFIHVKGFKSLGYARKRLGYSKQPTHKEIQEFAKKLEKELKDLGYKKLGEQERSCVVLLGKSKKDMKIRV
ncbi:MAG: 4-demethylwyosine synthase TYW1 [Nanoarchaeota archaeon]